MRCLRLEGSCVARSQGFVSATLVFEPLIWAMPGDAEFLREGVQTLA